MKPKTRRQFAAAIIAAGAFAAGAAAAQTWRCGNSYSDRPCDNGRLIDTDDARSKAQQHDAGAAARRNAKVADTLAQDRQRLEAAAPRGPAVVAMPSDATPAPAPKRSEAPKTPKRSKTRTRQPPEYFTARDPLWKPKAKASSRP